MPFLFINKFLLVTHKQKKQLVYPLSSMMSGGLFWSLSIHAILLSCLSQHPGFKATATSLFVGNETDRLALLAFKDKITDDPLRVMSSWNESIHFCLWHGVTCGRRHQRVTMLNLQAQQLVGYASPHIGNLSFLRTLMLHNNGFSSKIPQELGRLFRLRILHLENNSFSGAIPANISRCSNLIYLGLGGNKLVGNIPLELGSLSKLQKIVIPENNLTGGVPPFLGNFSSLEVLAAAGNNFGGSIPNTLGRLTRLRFLLLGLNTLSGTIPFSIYNLSTIITLSVPVNQIQGRLPLDLGLTLPNLQRLNLFENQFSGPIPVSISNALQLSAIIIGKNNFTGNVPALGNLSNLYWLGISENNLGSGEADDVSFLSSLINCTSLRRLGLNDNNFGGMLPKGISNFSTQLTFITLGRNRLFGTIPTGLANLINLETLSISMNEFTGSIPPAIGKLQKLRVLDFFGNKFTGDIPSSLGNLTLITDLFLAENNLEGSIPSSLGKCRSLLDLGLSRNNLTGTIPQQLTGLLSSLVFLDLSRNHLVGPLPMEVSNLRSLVNFDISNNKLDGVIPSSLGSCTSLGRLHFEGNFFQGTIPSSLSSLRGIEDLDLSHNNLSGQIPKYLDNFFFLQNLNLSFNDFEGEVPTKGVFKNASAISIVGNNRLCGGIPELQLPACTVNGSKKHSLPVSLKIIIPIVCGLLVIALMSCFIIICWVRKTKKERPLRLQPPRESLLGVSYESLLKATEGFSSANLIGVGSFGSVYKGTLEQDGSIVAVKVLNLQRQGAFKSFMAECEALRSIRHRNLVKVITACSSVDFQGNDFKALVYEFMANGSLEGWLHPTESVDEAHEEPRNFNVLQRLNIAIDVASALDYLHNHCQAPIVHCDIKPSNVLLDFDMTAHMGDFGLVRFLGEATHTSSAGLKGSIGYAAPEYGLGSAVSTYGDVYSYGILLLEMVTGKRPTDGMFEDGLNLHNYVKMALPERVMDIALPQLFQIIEEEETCTKTTCNESHMRSYKIQECLILILKIGVACSMESPRERMGISEAAAELHRIRKILLGTGRHGESDLHS